MQVMYLGRAPRTKETVPDFLKWRRVTRPPLAFRGLTDSQRTPGFWGVTKGTPVRDHVLNMANYINEEELHGAIIDERTQVSIILDSLTPDFLQFTSNYVMNKLDYNVTQLLNELQTFEAISTTRTQKAEANVAKTKALSSSNNKKKRKNNKGASAGRPKKKQAAPKASDKKKGSKGKCFHCGVDGHWKRNCNKYLSELKEKKKGKFDLLVLEANLVEVDSQSWILDSGSTNHICSSLQMLSSSRELADGECSMVVGKWGRRVASCSGSCSFRIRE